MEAMWKKIPMEMPSSLICDMCPCYSLVDHPSDVFTKAKQKLGYHEDDDIAVDRVLNIGHPPNVIRRVIPIDSQLDWENYVTSAMKTQL
jgi:hypothetical protein